MQQVVFLRQHGKVAESVDEAHNNLKTLLAMFDRERALFGYDVHDGIVQYLVIAMIWTTRTTTRKTGLQ